MDKKKLWASAHKPSPEQGTDFVFLEPGLQARLNQTGDDPQELRALARELLNTAHNMEADIYQPGGSPAFQCLLGQEALEMATGYAVAGCRGVREPIEVGIFYAHSVRESTEEVLPDGSVKKVAVFRHRGWIDATPPSRIDVLAE
jgi:hypothetical protein